jgi:polysaccharide biosynthesis/export protein
MRNHPLTVFNSAWLTNGKGGVTGEEELRFQRACAPLRMALVAACLCLGIVLPCFSLLAYGQTPVAGTEKPDATVTLQHQSAGPRAGSNPEYVIAADDVLELYVVDVPEFSRDYRVDPDGTITLPLLSSPVMAEGLTLNQLSAVIANKLRAAGLVSHPHVVASVKSSQAHAVAISGAVQNPQIYPIFAPTTLLDVLSQAGGLAPDAGDTAIVTRGETATSASWLANEGASPLAGGSIKVNLRKLLATGNPNLNITIYPGDKVTVLRAGVVYVVGAVERPGGFTLSSGRDKMTVLQAVALGEGLKPTAVQKKAMIIRRGRQFPGGRGEIAVNLKEILAGQASDPGLEANDILFVPDSASKRALRRGAEAAVQIATGLVIWGHY